MEPTGEKEGDVPVPCTECITRASQGTDGAAATLCQTCLSELKTRAAKKRLKQQDQPKQDFSSKRAERSEDKEAIGADLKRLSNACNEILNKRDFDLELPGSQEFVDCLATEFRSRFDNMTEPVSFSDQMALWQEFAKQHPEFNFRIIDMAVLFDQRLKKASVEVRFSIRGVSNIIMEAVARLKWRREDRGWVCFDLTAMRFAVPTFM